ncbi:kinesin [Trypanosoma grayi]|uniref:kinesin n=1 Tax=Trypanosoma grayi TaxID=71804 RepID=UPI0004F493F5|nr:kinesin [Trypanosoma grayi]KEG12307.1 kinesin [Trypanosoma grayi]
MEQRITVAVRIRPPLEKERFEPLCARKADDGQTIVIKSEESMGEPVTFQFDDVYDGSDYQTDVYEQSVQELVDHALQGANATVLTYGQTGSGKTYTILGSMSNGQLTDEAGIFPRVFHDLFTYKEAIQNQIHMAIFLSAVELYVEDVMDLLAQRKKIKLRETPEETITPGVNTVEVLSMEDVMQNFKKANAYRSVTSTKMNDSSSRSHALFFIDIFQVPIKSCSQCPTREQLIDANGIPINSGIKGLVRSRIALVDLAGSERVKRSGVEGQAMVEAQAINKSLSALGTTINAMYVESNHIPFRESKLTKLLKPSFVDRSSRLLLIGQISPPSCSAQESQGTLRFCDRVKGLKAGKVTGILDPEEEERYLRSLRQHDELSADLRIAGVLCYYKPQRPQVIAKLKNISVTEARNTSIAALQKDADKLVARKEAEQLRKMEAQVAREHEKMAQTFADEMNRMIEEYETEAREVKKAKKAAKRLKEAQEVEVEEKLTEAKKAKKCRLRLEEKLEQLRSALEEAGVLETEMDHECAHGTDEVAMRSEEPLRGEKKSRDNAVHTLVESFHSHATELGHLHDLYAQRLGATQRQRSQVRRTKLLSSTALMESTLVYDIIDFMIDRSVDIADGVTNASQQYSWNDIEGLSSMLRSGEQWYPPLVAQVGAAAERCEQSVYHNATFLSSDDSDEENSHYPGETRRRYVEGRSAGRGSIDDGRDGSFAYSEASDLPPPTREANALADAEGRGDGDVDADGNEGEDELGQRSNEADEPKDETEMAKAEKLQRRKRQDQEYLMRVYDSPTLVQEVIKFLRGGTVMLKHGRNGKPHRRVFWVAISQHQRKLQWADPDTKGALDRSSIDLSDVSYIQLGCFSKVFKRYPSNDFDRPSLLS